LVVRTAGDGSGGVLGGIVYSVRLGDTVPQLVWGYDTVGGAKPAFPAGYSVYRLVVHKTDYTLFINGQQVVQFKLADARTGQRVGLWTVNQAIQVTSFTVSRLQAAAPLPVKTINLGPSDVPSPLLPQEGHYFSAEELSRVDNLPVSTLESRGFAAAYGVSYATQTLPDSGPEFIDSVVNAATSPVAAQQQMARDLAHDQAFAGKLSNYTTGDLSGLGDQAHQLRYDWSTASAQFTRIDLYLTRGSYDIEIGEDFIRGTVSQADMVSQTLALAKIMDQRAQQAG
jgi:hypothetical protein